MENDTNFPRWLNLYPMCSKSLQHLIGTARNVWSNFYQYRTAASYKSNVLSFKKLLLSECCTAKCALSLRVKFNLLDGFKSTYIRKIEYQKVCMFDKNVTFSRLWPTSIHTQDVSLLFWISLILVISKFWDINVIFLEILSFLKFL